MQGAKQMKVSNMIGKNGSSIPNQFIITESNGDVWFQSYDSNIVKVTDGYDKEGMLVRKIYLDSNYWDYSVPTGKYRNQFLGETKKETQAKIDSGEYILTDLN